MFFWLMSVMLLLTACAKENVPVSIPAEPKVTKLSDILENPADYDNKKVLLEGVVGPGCLSCPGKFPYQEGANVITVRVKDFKLPNLKWGQPIRVYAEVKVVKEKVVIWALAVEPR